MKFGFTRAAAYAALCIVSSPAIGPAQSAPQSPPAQQEISPSSSQPKGQVIFSRSIDENGQVVTQAPATIVQPGMKTVTAPTAEDADRRAVTYTNLDLDVHLRTAEQRIAVRALLTVRNNGESPLARIPLQISSSLNWERVRADGRDVAFTVATLNSDTDHTGQLHEVAVPLATPLAPGESAQLDVTYSGIIPADAKRLLAIGAPDDTALLSDWDRIGVDFTGLRGFGNVVWYPVSSVPVILGDGARVFDEIGRHKLRLAGAQFRLKLTVEFPPGQAPTVALINGHPAALNVTDSGAGSEVEGVATASLGPVTLGFEAPSLFVAIRAPHLSPGMNVWTLPEDSPSADAWTAAAAAVTPFLQEWLGQRPQSQLTVIDLPDPHDAPYETGCLLAAPIRPAAPAELEAALAHALTHSYIHDELQPPPAWLDEGVATFMGALWTEKQQGREQALESLESSRPALALAEPESPGENPGQPLASAISPVYYRTKAAYVLWMLRDIAGDAALSAALRADASAARPSSPNQGSHDPKQGTGPNSTAESARSDPARIAAADLAADIGNDPAAKTQRTLFEKLLEQSGPQHDLSWFFADWVNADHGLPDLSIESVFPSMASTDSWLVTVNLANSGYAAAEVPVTVRSAATSITQRVLIPARGKVSRRILIQSKPTEVQLNDGTVPETQATVHVTTIGEPAQNPQP
ncbi:MAG: hypothetical protein WBE76_28035 [Terracidiphilus sp.]